MSFLSTVRRGGSTNPFAEDAGSTNPFEEGVGAANPFEEEGAGMVGGFLRHIGMQFTQDRVQRAAMPTSGSGTELITVCDINKERTHCVIGSNRGLSVLRLNPLTFIFKKDFFHPVRHVCYVNLHTIAFVSEENLQTVSVWDDQKRAIVASIATGEDVAGLRFEGGKVVVISQSHVRFFSLEAGKLAFFCAVNTAPNPRGVCAVGSQPDSPVIVVAVPAAQTGHFQVHHVIIDNGMVIPVHEVSAHNGPIYRLGLSRDTAFVATASDKGTVIRVFKTESCSLEKEFRRGSAENAEIHALEFSSDNAILAVTSNRGTCHFFGLGIKNKKSIISDMDGSFAHCSCCDKNSWALFALDMPEVYLFGRDRSYSAVYVELNILQPKSSVVTTRVGVKNIFDDSILYSHPESTREGNLHLEEVNDERINSVTFNAGKTHVTFATREGIKVFQLSPLKLFLTRDLGPIRIAVQYLASNLFFIVGEAGNEKFPPTKLCVYDDKTDTVLAEMPFFQRTIAAVYVTQTRLFVGVDNSILMYSFNTLERLHAFESVQGLSHLFAANIEEKKGGALCYLSRKDEKYIFSTVFCDRQNKLPVRTDIDASRSPVSLLAISPKGDLIAALSEENKSLTVYRSENLMKGELAVPYISFSLGDGQLGALSMEFNGEGTMIAVSFFDGMIKVFSIDGSVCVCQYNATIPQCKSVISFSPEGDALYVCGFNHTLFTIDIPYIQSTDYM